MKKKQFPDDINIYLVLCDLYKELNDNKSLHGIIQEMKKKFPESYYTYIEELYILFLNKNYKKAEDCFNKIESVLNLNCKKKYVNKELEELKIENKFYIEPDKYHEMKLIIRDNKNIYRELISFYFNLCYKDRKYIDIAYDCVQKSKLQENDEDKDLLFIKSLLLMVKGEKKDAHKTFSSIFTFSLEDKDTFEKNSLYFVLYYDKNKNILIFNPFDIYKSSIVDLNDMGIQWSVINQENESILSSEDKKNKYLRNIAYVFQQLESIFTQISVEEVEIAKSILLNINYLVKDAAFVDEKELRMISINELNSDALEHDKNTFTLYKDYMTVLGKFRYNKRYYLKEIILGPKVSQKETVAEYFVNHLNKHGLDNVSVAHSTAPLA